MGKYKIVLLLCLPIVCFAHSKKSALIAELNPVSYGADPSGTRNSTDAINKCIKDAVRKKIKRIVFDKGDYLLSTSGIDNKARPYSASIENANNLEIDGQDKAKIFFPLAEMPTPANAFRIFNSSNVTIKNLNFQAVDTSRNMPVKLYTGAGIYCDQSKNIMVKNCNFISTVYAVCAFNSSSISIIDNTFINGNYYNKNCRPKSAVLLFSTGQSVVSNNKIYGALVDGDLSLFGIKTDDCIVSNNQLFGYRYDDPDKQIKVLAQGITIDQGPRRNVVKNNFVYGYFYGIDVKAETYDNLIDSNTVQFCKVAIAERRGEAVNVSFSLNNIFSNNKIIMGGNWQSNYLFWGLYKSVGIMSENRANFTCEKNNIVLNEDSSDINNITPWTAIAVRQNDKSSTKDSMDIIINDNVVNYLGSSNQNKLLKNNNNTTSKTKKNFDVFYICNIKKAADLSSNKVSLGSAEIDSLNSVIKIDGNNKLINIVQNSFDKRLDKKSLLKINNAARIEKLNNKTSE